MSIKYTRARGIRAYAFRGKDLEPKYSMEIPAKKKEFLFTTYNNKKIFYKETFLEHLNGHVMNASEFLLL